jgi:hypothetical protein
MGQCIYVAMTDNGIVTREIPSELWMKPEAAGKALGVGHLLNTTIGVWFYETDVWTKRDLGKRLRALADYVTSPGFLPSVEDYGKELRRRSPKAVRNLRPPLGPKNLREGTLAPPRRRPPPGKRIPSVAIQRILQQRKQRS